MNGVLHRLQTHLHSYFAARLNFIVHAGSPRKLRDAEIFELGLRPPKNLGPKWANHSVFEGLSNPGCRGNLRGMGETQCLEPSSVADLPLNGRLRKLVVKELDAVQSTCSDCLAVSSC